MKNMLDSFKKELRVELGEEFKTNLKPVREEIDIIKKTINQYEKSEKRNNVIVYGVPEEDEENYENLESKMLKLLVEELKIEINENNISYITRLGRKDCDKTRPILVKFCSYRHKRLALIGNKALKDKAIYISPDYTNKELDIRKDLIPKMMQARNEGKYAIIKGTKLIVEEWKKNKKRILQSPESPREAAKSRKKVPNIRSFIKTNKQN